MAPTICNMRYSSIVKDTEALIHLVALWEEPHSAPIITVFCIYYYNRGAETQSGQFKGAGSSL